MGKLVENIYRKYQKFCWTKKFQCAGVYIIFIDNKIAYIGKSKNILYRMAEHWASMTNPIENKYKVLSEAASKNYKVRFDVLYQAKSQTIAEINEEIGEREGYFIRKYKPPLNYQIPTEENWQRFTTNKKAQSVTLDQIMKGEIYE